jgi:HEAT repeat protein
MGIDSGLSRARLVERLREERDPGVLGAFLSHPAWQVRWEAIESLGKTTSPDAERQLLQVLATSSDEGDLSRANAALTRVGSKAAIPALSAFIHHQADDVKCSAIHALGALGDPSLTPLYLDALSDRSWVAKWYAMAAIHRNADERAIKPVIDRLRSALSRHRQTKVGGWSEVMYALDFLRRWQTDPSTGATIEWVRSDRLDHLQPDERDWFDSTFPR